jgi:hypothetical protein
VSYRTFLPPDDFVVSPEVVAGEEQDGCELWGVLLPLEDRAHHVEAMVRKNIQAPKAQS